MHINQLNPLDFFGALLSLSATYFFIKAKSSAWLFSLGAIAVDFVLYYQKGIYGDMWLNCVYLITVLYGIWYWTKKNAGHKERLITKLTYKHGSILTAITVFNIFLIHYFLRYHTHSQVPTLDAITTALSLTAQWLTCRKILENWVVWFLADSIYIFLYFYKGIPMHAALYAIYLLLAVIGYYQWLRLMKQQ